MKVTGIITLVVFFTALSDGTYCQMGSLPDSFDSSMDSGFQSNQRTIGESDISPDGKFVWYTMGQKVTIIELSGSSKWQYSGLKKPQFTADSKKAIFLNRNDSLCILDLSTHGFTYCSGVANFVLFNDSTKSFLLFQLKPLSASFVFQNLSDSANRMHLDNIKQYFVLKTGNLLVVKNISSTSNDGQSLILLEPANSRSNLICTADSIENITVDESGNNIAFIKINDGKKVLVVVTLQKRGLGSSNLLI